MGRNQNQNSNQGISDDDIDNILGGIKDWIGNVDTKISFLLTVSCIFLGFIIENDIVYMVNWKAVPHIGGLLHY